MELYVKVRLACADGMSRRAAPRHFNISRGSVRKMLAFSAPRGYRQQVSLTPAQLAMLLEGIDWRMPRRTWQPEAAG